MTLLNLKSAQPYPHNAADFRFGSLDRHGIGDITPGNRHSKPEHMHMQTQDMTKKIADGNGFIAALDQSGGSTPKALLGYGVEESA